MAVNKHFVKRITHGTQVMNGVHQLRHGQLNASTYHHVGELLTLREKRTIKRIADSLGMELRHDIRDVTFSIF